jgi:hypothetical protein
LSICTLIYRFYSFRNAWRLTPCSPGARRSLATITKPASRAPVQRLLGTIVYQKRFGPRILAHCSIGGLFSPLFFFPVSAFLTFASRFVARNQPGLATKFRNRERAFSRRLFIDRSAP